MIKRLVMTSEGLFDRGADGLGPLVQISDCFQVHVSADIKAGVKSDERKISYTSRVTGKTDYLVVVPLSESLMAATEWWCPRLAAPIDSYAEAAYKVAVASGGFWISPLPDALPIWFQCVMFPENVEGIPLVIEEGERVC